MDISTGHMLNMFYGHINVYSHFISFLKGIQNHIHLMDMILYSFEELYKMWNHLLKEYKIISI